MDNFSYIVKSMTLKSVYTTVNNYYNNLSNIDIESELEKIAIQNNFDILIKNDQNVSIYTFNKDFFSTLGQMNEMTNRLYDNAGEIIEKEENRI